MLFEATCVDRRHPKTKTTEGEREGEKNFPRLHEVHSIAIWPLKTVPPTPATDAASEWKTCNVENT